MKRLPVVFFMLIGLAAHSQPVTDSVLIEGHYRSFTYYKPAGHLHNGNLLFIMHGSGGNSSDMFSPAASLQAAAPSENLLIVYPQGYLHYWNECRKFATSAANKEDINENAFFTMMIGYFAKQYGISRQKVFAAGFSGGGQMAYKLALTMPGQITAIAAIVANMPNSASCDCKLAGKPKPVLIINGTDDKTNPWNGGEMFVNNSSYGVVRSSLNTFAYWWQLAGYTGKPAEYNLPDRDTADHKTIESFTYSLPGKPMVKLLKVNGGHHDYPNDIDVYKYVWAFFKAS